MSTIGPSVSQNSPYVSRIRNFAFVGNGIALGCSSSSANVALPALASGSSATDLLVVNNGDKTAFIAFGTANTVAAVIPTGTAANGIAILPGITMVLDKGTYTYVAGITASDTTTLYLYQGLGS